MNISYLLFNSSNKFANRTAITSENRNFSYKHLNERVNRLAHAMMGKGLNKGDRVALIFSNTHHFAEIYFASLKIGAVITPINNRFVGKEIEYILNNSEASFLFFDCEFENVIGDIQDRLETVKCFIRVGRTKNIYADNYESFLSCGKGSEPEISMDEHDPCQIIYTSGTTGRPKGVVLSHGNIYWNLINTIYLREHREGERSLIISPLYHAAALNNHFTTQIALGGTSIFIKKFEPETVLKSITQDHATVISGAPAMFKILIEHPKIDQYNTSSIIKCTSGSSILPREIHEKLIQTFPNAQGIYDLYGCTEASPTITSLNATDSLKKYGSVGLPAPFLQARVIDPDGESLPPNEIGELVCKGPNVMRGYFKDQQSTNQVIIKGWLYTGDMAKVDDEGYFYIVDRRKDMIVSGGENIYPREIEEVILNHPSIADAAVVGIPHLVWGESVKAFLVLANGKKADEKEIISYCKKHMASYKKPTSVEFIDSLPINSLGKVEKKLLKERIEKAHFNY